MLSLDSIRYLGLAGLIGWALFIVALAIHPPGGPREVAVVVSSVASGVWVPIHVLAWVGIMLGLLGLFGVYARQSGRAGILGSVGFILMFFGYAIFSGAIFVEFAVQPRLVVESPQLAVVVWPPVIGILWYVLIAAGGIVFGVSVVRAKVLPSKAGYLLIVSALVVTVSGLGSQVRVLPFQALLGADILFAIAMVWLGYSVWSAKSVSVPPAQKSPGGQP